MSYRPISIRRRLLSGLTAAIVLLWCIVAAFVYDAAQKEVEEVFDTSLSQEASVLATLLLHEAEEEEDIKQNLENLLKELGPGSLEHSPLLAELAAKYLGDDAEQEEDYLTLLPLYSDIGQPNESKIAFLVRYSDGRIMLRSHNAPILDAGLTGFYTLEADTMMWRVFNLVVPSNGLQVQVSEKMTIRQETVRHILIHSLWPMLLSLPILGLIIWGSVGSSLRPLRRITETVEQRDPGSLQPISTTDVPPEVTPMIEALNGLFLRVHNALENERRFTANAAHEMRTPLAALKTQAQAAQLDADNKKFMPFLSNIINGVDRATHLLEQLLTLARADAQQSEIVLQQQADLHVVTLNAVSAMSEQARESEIDLKMEDATGPIYIRGDGDAISILLRNLIDNAIRYTPAGGEVVVKLEQDKSSVRLVVADTGKGVPPEMQAIMFQRFQRGASNGAQGSGLGLSIVKQITDLHRADISITDRADGHGLIVTITFPV